MGKFHDDGTLEIGGFGAETTEETSTVCETDRLKSDLELFKRLHSTLEVKNSYLTAKVNRLERLIDSLSKNYTKSLRVITVALLLFSILNIALTIARLFI